MPKSAKRLPLKYRLLERFPVGADPHIINTVGIADIEEELAINAWTQEEARRQLTADLGSYLSPNGEVYEPMIVMGEKPVIECDYAITRLKGDSKLQCHNLGKQLIDAEEVTQSQRIRQASILIAQAQWFSVALMPKMRRAGMLLVCTRKPGFGIHWCTDTADERGLKFVGDFLRMLEIREKPKPTWSNLPDTEYNIAGQVRCWTWNCSEPRLEKTLTEIATTFKLEPRHIDGGRTTQSLTPVIFAGSVVTPAKSKKNKK